MGIMLAVLRKSPGGPDGWDKVNGVFIDGLRHERAFPDNGDSCEQDKPESLPPWSSCLSTEGQTAKT